MSGSQHSVYINAKGEMNAARAALANKLEKNGFKVLTGKELYLPETPLNSRQLRLYLMDSSLIRDSNPVTIISLEKARVDFEHPKLIYNMPQETIDLFKVNFFKSEPILSDYGFKFEERKPISVFFKKIMQVIEAKIKSKYRNIYQDIENQMRGNNRNPLLREYRENADISLESRITGILKSFRSLPSDVVNSLIHELEPILRMMPAYALEYVEIGPKENGNRKKYADAYTLVASDSKNCKGLLFIGQERIASAFDGALSNIEMLRLIGLEENNGQSVKEQNVSR